MLFGGEHSWGPLGYCVIHQSPYPPTDGADLLLNFGSPLVSPEWLKLRLEILHAYRGRWALSKTMQKWVIGGREGSRGSLKFSDHPRISS